ncbi:MAG TPA: hypothetical protein ENK11_05240 [Phycisphaerales bacterium]|nr:hypothetical protein [Phycisphaerales bacterium]
MPRLSTIICYAALLACSATLAPAGRITLSNRIGLNDPYGGSRFAQSLHELSEQGKLSPPPPRLQIDQDYIETYCSPYSFTNPYRYAPPYFYGYHDEYAYRYSYYPYGIDNRLRDGQQPSSQMTPPPASTQTSNTQSSAPVVPPGDLEQARAAFATGKVREASRLYQKFLGENADDFAATAELAAVLIADGRLDDGAATMLLAYRSDPGLASRPLSDRVLLRKRAWRELVIRAVRHAHKRGSASSWLTVAVLMQAEGRPRVALRMLERAEQAGLDRSIATPLAAVLR